MVAEAVQNVPAIQRPLIRVYPTQDTSARIKHIDVWLHKYLLLLQTEQPQLIPENTNVINKYSARRSLRRGSTTQARNKGVPCDIIKLNNRWRSEENAGHRLAQGSGMLEVYTNVLAALKTLLQYSAALLVHIACSNGTSHLQCN
ncbi:hypothetical protein ACA910_005706 [Epithemia clementina (nom. ined.)]